MALTEIRLRVWSIRYSQFVIRKLATRGTLSLGCHTPRDGRRGRSCTISDSQNNVPRLLCIVLDNRQQISSYNTKYQQDDRKNTDSVQKPRPPKISKKPKRSTTHNPNPSHHTKSKRPYISKPRRIPVYTPPSRLLLPYIPPHIT